jgi:hypothetical protein
VDKVVDNPLLTGWRAAGGAGFNKMPVWKANFFINKINDLQTSMQGCKFNLRNLRKIFFVHKSHAFDKKPAQA